MARRRHGVHRKRFGGWNLIWKFATLALVVAAVVMALILFFRVETIRVEGEEHYSEQEILQASGLKKGDNMYLLNKAKAADRVTGTLPYVRNVRIYRELPSTIIVEIRESPVAGILITAAGDWVLNAEGKIMEARDPGTEYESAVIDGVNLKDPIVGKKAETAEDESYRFGEMLRLLQELESKGLLDKVQAIHLGESDMMTMEYADRFTVCLPWDGDYEYKLRGLEAVIDELEINETGTIDMLREDGEVHFYP